MTQLPADSQCRSCGNQKFEDVASRWWDLEGEFKPLHRINPLRLAYIQQRVNGVFGKKVLDVGCGGGILAESMAREGADVTGWIWAQSRFRLRVCMHWKAALISPMCRKRWNSTQKTCTTV